jgi:hypothetical protein
VGPVDTVSRLCRNSKQNEVFPEQVVPLTIHVNGCLNLISLAMNESPLTGKIPYINPNGSELLSCNHLRFKKHCTSSQTVM